MLKFIVLFFAAFAVFSPLFLIGIRKYTGRRAKRALGANIASFFAFLVLASVVGIGGSASAAGSSTARSTFSVRRWVAGSNSPIASSSSPKNSARTGCSIPGE